MARPRKDAEGPGARERLAAVFWESLSEAPFSQMTVMGISRRAGVNHNTFYRYFDGLPEMAEALFSELTLDALPAALLAGGADRRAAMQASMDAGDVGRAFLLARSGDERLVAMVRGRIRSLWLSATGVDEASLSMEQRIDLDIVFGGLVAAMGDADVPADPSLLASIAERPLGRGIFETLSALAHAAQDR